MRAIAVFRVLRRQGRTRILVDRQGRRFAVAPSVSFASPKQRLPSAGGHYPAASESADADKPEKPPPTAKNEKPQYHRLCAPWAGGRATG